MPNTSLPWIITSSLRAILGEDYVIDKFEELPSRRHEVYKITGSKPLENIPNLVVAKLFHQPGIANETYALKIAHEKQVPVPRIIGTTSDVLILEYIAGPNLCDLITTNPNPDYGKLLASWLAYYHHVFRRNDDKVLIKGDTRIRNFLLNNNHLFGVDFEESHFGRYHKDLAVLCSSILDTTPLFTKGKIKLCTILLEHYATLRLISELNQLISVVTKIMSDVLWETSARRGHPPELEKCIERFEEKKFDLQID